MHVAPFRPPTALVSRVGMGEAFDLVQRGSVVVPACRDIHVQGGRFDLICEREACWIGVMPCCCSREQDRDLAPI